MSNPAWLVQDAEHSVKAVAKPYGHPGRVRVFVFGPVGIQPPTVPYRREDEDSRSVWRSYRRARVAANRAHALDAVARLVGWDLGRLKTRGDHFVADRESEVDLYVRIKRK